MLEIHIQGTVQYNHVRYLNCPYNTKPAYNTWPYHTNAHTQTNKNTQERIKHVLSKDKCQERNDSLVS